MASQMVTVELGKEKQKFSSAHFTMFSSCDRENVHGHNFHVRVRCTATVGDAGICFDLQLLKDAITTQCGLWNEHLLLPDRSPWLLVEREGEYTIAHFDGTRLPFLHRDVLLLPARNGSLEELARVFLDGLIAADTQGWANQGVRDLEVAISTEPGQYAAIATTLADRFSGSARNA